jgi:hypothetical protein
MIAILIECLEEPRPVAPGHPPAQTIRVLATLRQFLREGTPWRSLRADAHKVSGSTLRRWLTGSARTGLLRKVHALLNRVQFENRSPAYGAGGADARPHSVIADGHHYRSRTGRGLVAMLRGNPHLILDSCSVRGNRLVSLSITHIRLTHVRA